MGSSIHTHNKCHQNCILISFTGFLSLEMGQLRERIQLEAKGMW